MAARPLDDELEQLFDHSLNAVFIAGLDGYLRRVNRGFARRLGYSHEAFLARPFIENVHPDDVEAVRAAVGELAAGKDLVAFECRQVTADGWVRWTEWHAIPRLEEGVVFGIGLDITDWHVAMEQVGALRRVATLVAEVTQTHDLFARVAAEVARVIEVPAVSIASYEADDSVVFRASSEEREGFEAGMRQALDGPSVVAEIRSSHEPARIDDYSELEGSIAEYMRQAGQRSTVGSPIVVAGRLWGAVVVSTPAPEPLPPDTETRLADFTELLGAAIANAESREALERLAEEQAALRRVATLAARGGPPTEIFSAVSREVGQLFGTDAAYVGRFDPDGPAIVAMGVAKIDPETTVGARWELDDSMSTAQVFRTGRSARVDGADWSSVTAPIGAVARRLGTSCAVSSPIIVDGRLWGAMSVAAREQLPPDTADRLEKFTALVATAIANAESREALERLAEEQAALRRVATLVAQGVPASAVFMAVSEEVGQLFGDNLAAVGRYDADARGITLVGIPNDVQGVEVGMRVEVSERTPAGMVYATGRSARVDGADWSSAIADQLGVVSSVTSPIIVEGRLWGAMSALSTTKPLPGDTEQRLERFSELVATAIANAESKSELAASRRRIVAASDEARRRIERDLHDGTQQRLVALGLAVRTAEADVPEDCDDLRSELSRIATGLREAVTELQEMSRGIHPAILSKGGLASALRALVRHSAVPVQLDITIEARPPEPIEVAAYYVASEAIANVTKHAHASRIDLSLAARNGGLQLSIRDDGVGGADPRRGSGLVGLSDRVEAVGGSIRVESPRGDGTHITAELPLDLESQTAGDNA